MLKRAYKYDAKEPVANLDLVNRTIRDANRYRNACVAIQLDTRRQTDAICEKYDPGLVDMIAERDELTNSISEETEQIKLLNQKEGRVAVNHLCSSSNVRRTR